MTKIVKFFLFLIAICSISMLYFVSRYIYDGIDWGYPDGEINFIGLNKQEVVNIIKNLKVDYNGNKFILVAVNGNNYKYFYTDKDVLSDSFVANADVWGVNYKENKRIFYLQILKFGQDGKVESQSVKRSWDGL